MQTDGDAYDYLQEFCHRIRELLDVPAVGVVFTEDNGALQSAAAGKVSGHLLEATMATAQERRENGHPAPLPVRPRYDIDLRGYDGDCPQAIARLLALGITRAAVLPLPGEGCVRGIWQVFGHETLPGEQMLHNAQQLADLTMTALDQSRRRQYSDKLAAQLSAALASRVVIEQAKGFLAKRWDLTPDDAFTALRAYARSNQRRLVDVAGDVISRRLHLPRGPVP
ncbi:ANTAR domain-containing protein [Streptomyces sclerotialus]|uniref:ANTAR domain-containing protein n=1 Tax=Streptomyces sclerotialus TaxID=1957 RepID=UPI00068B6A4F